MAPYCSEEHAMKHLIAISGMVAALVAASPPALAQSSTPPALPALSEQQSQEVHARIDAYRRATDARVERGEISADEAARLVAWREWQIAQQMAATTARANAPRDAGVPPDYDRSRDADAPRLRGDYESRSGDTYVLEPPPAYAPYPYYYRYPAPYYWGPRPYAYWGPSICAGGFGRHFGGRVCF
jgi:hypothetical protein